MYKIIAVAALVTLAALACAEFAMAGTTPSPAGALCLYRLSERRPGGGGQ